MLRLAIRRGGARPVIFMPGFEPHEYSQSAQLCEINLGNGCERFTGMHWILWWDFLSGLRGRKFFSLHNP
jgi:hypothetical protein